MGFLLEHGYTKSTSKRFFASVNAQMSFQIPRHPELFPAILTPILAHLNGWQSLFASSCLLRSLCIVFSSRIRGISRRRFPGFVVTLRWVHCRLAQSPSAPRMFKRLIRFGHKPLIRTGRSIFHHYTFWSRRGIRMCSRSRSMSPIN